MGNLDTYSSFFYEKQLLESRESANQVLPIINNWFKPKTIIDVGCGVGAWLEIWKNFENVTEIKGIDGSFIDVSLLRINKEKEFIQTDLNKTLPKIKSYDLALCLEVAEHLDEERAETFVADLVSLSNVIIFSAAIPGQEGTHHINEQYLGYWIDKFEANDYKCYDIIRPLIWGKKNISWWFRQNMVVFIKNGELLKNDLNKLQTFNCMDLVQKELLEHKINKYRSLVNRKSSFKNLLREMLNKIKKKIYEKR
ncbi:methyltransferase domain-containing protein [uncultured Lacinutrix sp.]|uniref:class I SAM-dependent methyltransferase n=1 Tax=uncultured Lacinutrix sp. TaxID=574032 RepID=UPI002613E371|nr:methyltransferase domain-containing protein [uncultured Lacinutrix sp.]